MSNTKNNWRELAELLGLPVDEPAPAAPPSPPAAPEPMPYPPAASVIEETHVVVEEFVPSVADEASVPECTVELDEVSIDEGIEENAAAEPATAESVEGDDKGRDEKRGRRRGRRGRRRGRGEPETAEGAAPGEAPAPAAEPARDDDRRGRRPAPRPERVEAETRDDAVALVDGDHDQDESFSEDLWADWNVPQWQELIDGLHRPDR